MHPNRHNDSMTATPPQPDRGVAPNAGEAPVVPYGPGPGSASATSAASAAVVTERSAARTAGKWAIRIVLPLLVRAIFRAIVR
jgi:hypothetical protein